MKHKWRCASTVSLILALILIGGSLWIVGRAFLRQQATHDLAVAVYKNDTASALAALHAGADPNTRQRPSDKPLTLMQFCVQFWQRMRGVKAPAQLDPCLYPPMIALAAAKNNTAMVQALLANGATPDVFTHYSRESDYYRSVEDDLTEGKSALMWAAQNDNFRMTKDLLDNGATANFDDIYQRGSALLYAAYDPAIIEMLLAHGANVRRSWKREKGITVLHSIVFGLTHAGDVERQQYYYCIKVFLTHGADINKRTWYGETPLLIAAQYNQAVDVRFLLAHGADPNFPAANGETPLERAINDGMTENVKVLLANGADPNRLDIEGRTPLFTAVEQGKERTVKALIAGGAKVNVQDNEGKTPLQLAEEDEGGGNDSVEDILRAAGARDY